MGKRTQLRNEIAKSEVRGVGTQSVASLLITITVTAFLTAVICIAMNRKRLPAAPHVEVASAVNKTETVVRSLLEKPKLPANSDIALLNLLTAPGLPTKDRDRHVAEHLAMLDRWSARIASETARNMHRFHANPGEFGGEAGWRMAMMCSVLGKDFGVRYDPKLATADGQAAPDHVFYVNPDSVFLTGCLGKSRMGTCASLPVLYVAVGRRIGYPMHLVSAKGHLFARWDDGKGNRVNLEASNAGGFTSHPDDYYRNWPRPITPMEEKSIGYLRNMTPEEALAVFMSKRVGCLRAGKAETPALTAAWAAYRLAPHMQTLGLLIESPALRPSVRPAHDLRGIEEAMMMNQRNRMMNDPIAPHAYTHQPRVVGQPAQGQMGIPQPAMPAVHHPYPTPGSHSPPYTR